MIFRKTPLDGAFVVELERREDARGFFARSFCSREFAAHGLADSFCQTNISLNHKARTLRGMHYQAAPHREAKVVRCTHGALYDVVADLRPSSPTRLRWLGVELSRENGLALYVPPGFAHGFLTLCDDTEVQYLMSTPYVPGAERGLRFDDPALGIRWPAAPAVVSERDRAYPDFDPERFDG